MTYHSGEGLEGNARAVLPQVERVVIVDNASGESTRRRLETLAAAQPGRIELVLNPANRGLGAILRTLRPYSRMRMAQRRRCWVTRSAGYTVEAGRATRELATAPEEEVPR